VPVRSIDARARDRLRFCRNRGGDRVDHLPQSAPERAEQRGRGLVARSRGPGALRRTPRVRLP